MPVMIMTTVSGSRKNACPTTSMVSRSRFGSMLFTMSMRMCSLASSVHGEHSKNTMLNSTHCSSSQEFDEVSKILRTVALTADTTTAARISHAMRLPIQVVMASITRVTGSNALSTCVKSAHLHLPSVRRASRPPAGVFCFCLCPTCLAETKPPTLIRRRHEASMEKLVAGGARARRPGLGPGPAARARRRRRNPWLTNSKPSVNYARGYKYRWPALRGRRPRSSRLPRAGRRAAPRKEHAAVHDRRAA